MPAKGMPRLLACAVGALLFVGCGPKSSRGPEETPVAAKPRPAIEAALPVLRWVPADVDSLITGPRFEELLGLAEQALPLMASLGMPLEALDKLESLLQGPVFDASGWRSLGLDPARPVALFSQGLSLTVLIPRALSPTSSGPESTAETAPSSAPGASPSWASLAQAFGATDTETLEDSLAIRWTLPADAQAMSGLSGQSMSRESWVQSMHRAATDASYGGTPAAGRAMRYAEQVGGPLSGQLWGSLNLAAFLESTGLDGRLNCVALLRGVEGLSLSARLQGQAAEIHLAADLFEPAAGAVSTVLGPQANLGMLALRQGQGLSASLGMDPAALATALEEASCPLAVHLRDPLAELGFSPPPTSMHLAGSRFDTGDLSGELAVQLGLQSQSFIKRQLGQIPGRSLFESNIKIAGHKLKKLSVPFMSSLYYQLSDRRMLFATKKSLMSELLSEPSGAAELAWAKVVPERVPQLTQLLSLAMPGPQARELAAFLRQFSLLQLGVVLKDTRLELGLTIRRKL